MTVWNPQFLLWMTLTGRVPVPVAGLDPEDLPTGITPTIGWVPEEIRNYTRKEE